MTMKKVFTGLLAALMLLSLTACTGNKAPEGPAETGNAVETTQPVPEKQETEPSEEKPEDWGVQDDWVSMNDQDDTAHFYINFPQYTGIVNGSGLAAAQEGEALVIVDIQRGSKTPAVNGLEELFPAYFEQTAAVLEDYHGIRVQNLEFSIESQETLTVKGYEICKFVGDHTYTYEGEDGESKFVAYATQLKANGAYVYWMVLDYSEDQSQFDTIEEYAYKMALTLREAD